MKINIIKFGGSVITRPSSDKFYNHDNTFRLACELYPFYNNCIIIHGTGSVGKPPSVQHGYVKTGVLRKEDRLIALGIRNTIKNLNQLVVQTLISASIPAVSFDMINYFNGLHRGMINNGMVHAIKDILEKGMVPVLHGDFLPRRDGSFKVISSDLIVSELASNLNPEKVLFLTNTEGVYSRQPVNTGARDETVVPVLNSESVKQLHFYQEDRHDVSGGMRKKVELALDISNNCRYCFIGSGYKEGIIANYMKGRKVKGTLFINE